MAREVKGGAGHRSHRQTVVFDDIIFAKPLAAHHDAGWWVVQWSDQFDRSEVVHPVGAVQRRRRAAGNHGASPRPQPRRIALTHSDFGAIFGIYTSRNTGR